MEDVTSHPDVEDQPEASRRRAAAERARRRARVFGEVLPDATEDDRPSRSPGATGEAGEEWLRANVPPHHGT